MKLAWSRWVGKYSKLFSLPSSSFPLSLLPPLPSFQLCTSKGDQSKLRRPSTKGLLSEAPSDAHSTGYRDFDTASTFSGDSDVFAENEDDVKPSYHTVILDCAPIGFVDTMGAAMIDQV